MQFIFFFHPKLTDSYEINELYIMIAQRKRIFLTALGVRGAISIFHLVYKKIAAWCARILFIYAPLG